MFTRETAIRYSWARIGIELLLAVAASSLLVLFYQHVSTEYNKFDAAEISTRDTCKRKHDECIGASATGCREYNHDECLNATNPLRYTHQQFIKESVFDRHRELWGVDVARFADSQPFVVTAIAACHSKKQDRNLFSLNTMYTLMGVRNTPNVWRLATPVERYQRWSGRKSRSLN